MAFIKLQAFSGESPRTGPTLLQNNQSQYAANVKLQSGELRSWKGPTLAYKPNLELVKSIFRITDTEGDQYWLTWDTDVDAVEGPILSYDEARVYYTGDGPPKKTNSSLATDNGTGLGPYPMDWLHLGVPNPTAAPTVSLSQAIASVSVTESGSGYTSTPSVVFTGGGGINAAATAVIDAAVTGFTLTSGGANYTTAPAVKVSGANGTGVTANATINGKITSIAVTSGGSGYTSAPDVLISGGGGSGATATATVSDGAVTAVTLSAAGSGFTFPPTITFSGGGGSAAFATASIAGPVSKIEIVSGGSGFTGVPSVKFEGDGSGAAATASISGKVVRIDVTNGGSGYSSLPEVSFTGGGGGEGAAASASFAPVEARSYVYTYVSDFGTIKEESGPSPAVVVENVSTETSSVVISGFTAPPTDHYNITARRIYRSLAGANSLEYYFVAEIPLATTSYTDTQTATQLSTVVLPSLYWGPPPPELQGLTVMPNGIMAGFHKNEVWFSEPYYPHAWPEQYVLTTEFPIVGLGVYDTTLVVTTTRFPYLITGSHPSVMTQAKLPIPQACVSKRSIASDQYGVMYASPNGLVSIGPGVQDIVTQALYTRDEWQDLYPATILGVLYNNMYIGFHTDPHGTTALVMTRADQPPLVQLKFDARALYIERSTGSIFAVSEVDNNIYQLDSDEVNNTFYEWKSKKFVLDQPANFGAMKVQADYEYMGDIEAYNRLVAEITAYNEAYFSSNPGPLATLNDVPLNSNWSINSSPLLNIPPFGEARVINVYIYADGNLVHSTNMTSQEPVRLPAGFKAYVWEVDITGNTPVRSLVMASTISELRQVGG